MNLYKLCKVKSNPLQLSPDKQILLAVLKYNCHCTACTELAMTLAVTGQFADKPCSSRFVKSRSGEFTD